MSRDYLSNKEMDEAVERSEAHTAAVLEARGLPHPSRLPNSSSELEQNKENKNDPMQGS
jgi:hypothetical protein